MNEQTYRLRGILLAVDDTASGAGKASQAETTVGQAGPSDREHLSLLALRPMAFAVLLLSGVALAFMAVSYAQVIIAPDLRASAIQA
ncbi:hypothetical protein R75461_08431 [Paraburkholderia nemoris]|uniref:hypothetical protein n=1 Tax=Paraburkholderia nemoris TaxID=2793076 RepID=UPI00190A0787|nr:MULTISPECIES: hypothetical protein [Paraburkholderia]MBK3787204.1 hypothetical protein [Paraburkholderia aspalathi]CAE6868488.1 hypothetical protein R75461_08431 [Paraburkholderia nemoris]